MRRGVYVPVLVMAGLAGGAVAAQTEAPPEPVGAYDTCIAEAVAHFEAELSRARNRPSGPEFDIVTRDRAEFCGVLAIAGCDRSEAPLACQAELATRQVDLRVDILAAVPEPAEVAGRDPLWSDGLYPTLWAVARGSSAGPDCAGADEVYRHWCDTRQAGLKVSEAVMLWQVARLLGAAVSATEAGWAEAPPPPEPTPRPGAAP